MNFERPGGPETGSKDFVCGVAGLLRGLAFPKWKPRFCLAFRNFLSIHSGSIYIFLNLKVLCAVLSRKLKIRWNRGVGSDAGRGGRRRRGGALARLQFSSQSHVRPSLEIEREVEGLSRLPDEAGTDRLVQRHEPGQ